MTETFGKKRFFELDVLRGIAVAIMIIVDAPPTENYWFLKQAAWEGITIADMAFPGFVFAMGISAAVSAKSNSISIKKIFSRSAILFLLGLILNTLPFVLAYFFWTEFTGAQFFSRAIEHGRFFGILQRLALTYCLGMILVKFLQSDKKILLSAFLLLILSSAGFHIYSPENPFVAEHNLSSTIDLMFPGVNHILTPTMDYEGLYGTFSSAALMLLGFFTGKILEKNILPHEKIFMLLKLGGIFLSVGILRSFADIISKPLWTAPFTLLTAGIEIFLLIGILKLLGTNLNAEKILHPLESLGKNPLFCFCGSIIGLIFFFVVKIENIPAWHWIYQHTFQGIGSTEFSSMLFCFTWCILWILIAEILNKKNIVIKISGGNLMNFFSKVNNFLFNLPVEIYFVFFLGYFFVLNILMPLCYDDYAYAFIWDGEHGGNLKNGIGDLQRIQSVSDIIQSQYSHWLTWGGRVIGHGLAQFFIWIGKFYFDIANTLMLAVLVIVMLKLSGLTLRSSKIAVVWIFICLLFVGSKFGGTTIWSTWLTGACNYFWMTVALLIFRLPYVRNLRGEKINSAQKIFVICFGLVAGWSNESGAAATVCLTLFLIFFAWRRKNFQSWMALGFLTLLVGFALNIFAPGNLEQLKFIQSVNSVEFSFTSERFLHHLLHGFLPVVAVDLFTLLPVFVYKFSEVRGQRSEVRGQRSEVR